MDDHRLGTGFLMDGVALDGLGFRYHDGAGQPGQNNLSVGVGGIEAPAGQGAALCVYIGAVRVGQLKLHALQGGLGDGIQLVDDKIALGLIEELQGVGLMILDLDGLGGVVQQVALLGLDLLHHIATRLQVGNGDRTVFIGAELTIGTADSSSACGGDFKGDLAEGLLGCAVHLFDDQPAQWLIGDGHFLAAAALHLDGLGGAVEQIAFCGFGFRDGIAAGGNVT